MYEFRTDIIEKPLIMGNDYSGVIVVFQFIHTLCYGLNIARVDIDVNPQATFRCDVPMLTSSLFMLVNDTRLILLFCLYKGYV